MTTETPERPLASLLLDDGRPAWQQINVLFRKNGYVIPNIALRDELVTMWSWARYGEALARRSAASAEPAVTVKALEWVGVPADSAAETPFGQYQIGAYGQCWAVYFNRDLIAEPESQEAAKAAAQADYEASIRSALVAPPPSPVVSEAMVERAACAMHEVLGTEDADVPMHHPAEKSWEEPSLKRWQQWDEAARAALNAALSPAPTGEVGWRTMPVAQFGEFSAPFTAHRHKDDTISLDDASGAHLFWLNTHTQTPMGDGYAAELEAEAQAALRLAEAIAGTMNAALATPVDHGDERPAMRNAIRAAARTGDTVWRFKLYASDGWTYTDRPLSPKELGPNGRQEQGHFPTGGDKP